jgi:hypothetical protein
MLKPRVLHGLVTKYSPAVNDMYFTLYHTAAVDEMLSLHTEPFVHPEYKTTMAMLKTKVKFTLEGGVDV